jgi:hypothetical protein
MALKLPRYLAFFAFPVSCRNFLGLSGHLGSVYVRYIGQMHGLEKASYSSPELLVWETKKITADYTDSTDPR